MFKSHFLAFAIAAVVFYIIGAKFPGLANKIPGVGGA